MQLWAGGNPSPQEHSSCVVQASSVSVSSRFRSSPFPRLGRTSRAAPEVPAVSVFDFEDGLVRRERFYFDLASLCEQIEAPVEKVSAVRAGLRQEAA